MMLRALPRAAAGIAASFAKRAQTKLPSFPVDFFERAVCVSQQGDDIGFSSSSIAEGPAEHVRAFDATAKTRLSSSSEDYVTSLNKSTALDLVVHNSNHTSVVVGVRVLLGNAQPSAIPEPVVPPEIPCMIAPAEFHFEQVSCCMLHVACCMFSHAGCMSHVA